MTEFSQLCDSVTKSMFQLTGHISNLQRLSNQLGTTRDTHELRANLNTITDSTKEMIKKCGDDVKKLSDLEKNLPDSLDKHQRRLKESRITKDFQIILSRFQDIQKSILQKTKEFVSRARQLSVSDQMREYVRSVKATNF